MNQTNFLLIFAESEYIPKECNTIKSDSLYFHYSDDEATSWMRKDGKKSNELNVEKYLNSIGYDESN
jgi:hypothetical protein